MDSGQPYIYTCDCSAETAIQELKRYLVATGWSVEEEDVEAGVIAASKGLSASEKLQTTFATEELTGASTAGQTGRLSFQAATTGDTTGLGVLFSKNEEGVQMPVVIEGGPADSAGVEEGQFVQKINGTTVSNFSTQEVAGLISRRAGGRDTLLISSRANGRGETVVIQKAQVPSATVVQMRGQVQIAVNEQQTFSTDQSTQSGYAIRGHPMMVVHGRRVERQTDLTLNDPPPSDLPRAENER